MMCIGLAIGNIAKGRELSIGGAWGYVEGIHNIQVRSVAPHCDGIFGESAVLLARECDEIIAEARDGKIEDINEEY